MRLRKKQRRKLLEWVSEGLKTDEINARAAEFIEPFKVTWQQVDWYRKTRRIDIKNILAEDEKNALTTGLALKENRVAKLKALAEMMELDFADELLWTDQIKSIGSGFSAQVVEYQEFNAGEVTQYRGILDDIAKEVGDRVTKIKNEGELTININPMKEVLDKVYGEQASTDPGA